MVTPCTADPLRFSPSVSGASVRDALRVRADQVLFGWAGSFRRFHAVEQAVIALGTLRRSGSDAHLLLVGDGPELIPTQRVAQDLGLSDVVHFVGRVEHARVPEYVTAMDVAIVTAKDGAAFHYSPLKLMEYLSCGIPVVAPRVTQIELLLIDERDALLYPSADPAALAQAMRTLADDPPLRARIGRAGRARQAEAGSIGAQILAARQLLGV